MNIIKTIIASGAALLALGCTKMDEYLKISGDKEIVYPGKITGICRRRHSMWRRR